MRILFVNIEGHMAGAEHSLLLLAEELGMKHPVVVACPSKSPLETALRQKNIQTRRIPERPLGSHRSVTNLIHWTRVWISLVLHVRDFKPDFIHANTFYCAPPCIVAGLITHTRVIVHARDMIRCRCLHKLIGKFSSSIVAVSHSVKACLMDQGISPSKISVALNGVGTKDKVIAFPSKTPAVACSGSKTSDDVFVFANIGQFVPWKNQKAFLNAAHHVARKAPRSRFVVIGDDVFKHHSVLKYELQQQCLDLDIATRVQFFNWQQDLSILWHRIHCLVHTADQEPFGRVIVEAMAHQIPVIAINSGGPSEIIIQNHTGLLVPPNDTHQLTEAMVEIASNRLLCQRISVAGQNYVQHHLTSSQTTQRITHLYHELIQTG